MTERETLLAICKRLNILDYEGLDFIQIKSSFASEEIIEIWFNDDGTVDFIDLD